MEDKHRSGIWRCLRDGDFEEEEVWDVLKDSPDYHHSTTSHGIIPKSKVVSSSSSSSSSPIPVPRMMMIPSRDSSSSSTSSSHDVLQQQSAPVNIPDWSKIYNNHSNNIKKNKASNYNDVGDDDDDGDGDGDGDGDDDDFEDPKLPPHEVIARRLARSQISSFSVFEGVGRTLKGRDLSKVRNAVLIKTGFLESL